jgi:hypothetical protein
MPRDGRGVVAVPMQDGWTLPPEPRVSVPRLLMILVRCKSGSSSWTTSSTSPGHRRLRLLG